MRPRQLWQSLSVRHSVWRYNSWMAILAEHGARICSWTGFSIWQRLGARGDCVVTEGGWEYRIASMVPYCIVLWWVLCRTAIQLLCCGCYTMWCHTVCGVRLISADMFVCCAAMHCCETLKPCLPCVVLSCDCCVPYCADGLNGSCKWARDTEGDWDEEVGGEEGVLRQACR